MIYNQILRNIEKLSETIRESNSKRTIKMPKMGGYIKFKNFERKIKSSFMIIGDFQKLPKDNGKQTPNDSYTIKYKKTCCF